MTQKEIFHFPAYTRTGVPTFYNWLNANVSGYDGKIVDKKGTPGHTTGIFLQIPDEKLATERPLINHGKNDHESPEKIFVSGQGQIKCLFEHTYEDRPRWELNWRGYYGNKNWYQYFNACVYNTQSAVYPFATKGISMRLRVPSKAECNWINGKDAQDKKNHGNHLHINRAHGLWVDANGKYYIYRMKCHGDNRYYAVYGGDNRPKDGVIYEDAGQWWGDRNYFLENDEIPVGKTDDHMEESLVPREKNRSLAIFTNERNVENLFFCGFSLDIHHDRAASSKQNHSLLISRLTPIPYYSPRHDPSVRAVLGEPTELSEIRQGHRKIHLWDPPKEYYEWDDDTDYDSEAIPPDTPDPIDNDTSSGGGAPTDSLPGGIIEPSMIFVNDDGDGLPIPANFDIEEYEPEEIDYGPGFERDGDELIDRRSPEEM